MSGAHQRASGEICPKRLYMVCLETVAPMADEAGRMLCSVCFFCQLLPDNRLHSALVTCTVTSTNISVIKKSLLKPRATLGKNKFLGCFHFHSEYTNIFPTVENSTT
ncbi:hypothetical protein TNCV_202411 [Trichonephila clavipes]|nr:hypothetical protein TNCV_202411 [Trichonephila clavipes]